VTPLALLAIIALAWLVFGRSGGERAGGATPSDVPTAEVQRRTLAEQVTVDGTIGYAGKGTVINRLAGTITALPSVGRVIRRGQRLFAVDGEPVILMYGRVPAYRELAEGVSEGEDVRQLEENLAALGFDPGTVDGEFTATTASAVDDWQDELDLPQTGSVELGRVVFLPSARRVTEVTATLGSGGSSSAEGSGLTGGRADAPGGGNVLVAYDPTTQGQPDDTAPTDGSGEQPPPGGEQPSGTGDDGGGGGGSGGGGGAGGTGNGEQQPDQGASTPEPSTPTTPVTPTPPAAAAPAQPAAPSAPSPDSGGGGDSAASAPSTPVLETSSTRRIVTAELDADQQSLARRGRRVTVILPDGREAPGRVERVEAVPASSDESAAATGQTDTTPKVEATIELTGRGRIPALDGAAVSVTLTDRVRRDVLTVPLTALISIGGNRFAVIAREGSERRRIVVTPGLAAEGYVEVEGKGLREGMAVEAPE
jgi:Putative peptidoglycan binding domain